MTLSSLYEQEDNTVQAGQAKNIDFNFSYNRYSGSAKTDISKTLSVTWYVTNHDYDGQLSANFDFLTGVSEFTLVEPLLDISLGGFPLTSTSLSADQNRFLMQIDHTRVSAVTPNIYYEIAGETTKITGSILGI